MGINSRITKSDTLNWAVDILLFKKYCVDHSSFEKRWHIVRLWTACCMNYFWSSDNRDEKLAEMISQFELKFANSGWQDFNAIFRKIFSKKWLDKMRLSKQDYFQAKSLVGFVTNRNTEWREYRLFSNYKKASEDIKQELESLFISKMEKYQSKAKWELVDSLSAEEELYTECDEQEDTQDEYENDYENDTYDKNTESIEIMEFELEQRYLTEKSKIENLKDLSLNELENDGVIKKIMAGFEEEYKWFDESEIEAVKSLFYQRVNTNN